MGRVIVSHGDWFDPSAKRLTRYSSTRTSPNAVTNAMDSEAM